MVTNFEPEYRFTLPTGIEVDNEGRIFVVDNIRFRLQVYRKRMKQPASPVILSETKNLAKG